jgi:hyperosmotically inducible periplasmic protein
MTRTLVFFLALLFAFGPSLAAQSSDDRIHDQVIMSLARDPDVKGNKLEVEVKDGVVTLQGEVSQEKFRQKAERLTKKVKGVKSVVNELTVKVQ